MKFSMYNKFFKDRDGCHGLVSKAAALPFKQSYNNVRSNRQESAVNAGKAQSGKYFYRKINYGWHLPQCAAGQAHFRKPKYLIYRVS